MKKHGGGAYAGLALAAVLVLAAGSVAPAAVIPGTILTPGLWFEADVGVTVDGSNKVSTWADQSGGGWNATQTTAANRPAYVTNVINGKPVVRGFSSTAFLNLTYGNSTTHSPLNGLSGVTVFMVTSCSSATPNSGWQWMADGLDWDALGFTESAEWGCFGVIPAQSRIGWRFGSGGSAGNHTWTRPTNIGTAFSLTTVEHNVTTDTVYVGGTLGTTVTGAGDPLARISEVGYIGRGHYATYFPGDIAEIIVLTSAASNADRQAVESYLGGKYNIAPEPATMALMAMGGIGLLLGRRRRK